MRATIRNLSLCLAIVSIILGACGQGGSAPVASQPQSEERLKVVTSHASMADVVYQIGGDLIELHNVIPSGADVHTYEPSSSDAVLLAKADLLFTSGLGGNNRIAGGVIGRFLTRGTELVGLAAEAVDEEEYIYGRAGEHGDHGHVHDDDTPNPHLWLDPIYMLRYAEVVRDKLAAHDPANADAYRANYDAYAARIEALDAAIRATTASIPEAHRVLYTYHDSWVYFARRYGYTALGAIQPSDFSEPSAQEVAETITALRAGGVPAIFGSPVYPADVLEQVGREAGVDYGFLYDDSLPGEPGSPGHTFIGLMVENLKTMATALGGDPTLMEGVEVGVAFRTVATPVALAARPQGEPLRVVTSWAPLGNIVYNIAGDLVELTYQPAAVDSHTHEPRPSNAVHLAQADLVIFNALGLNSSNPAEIVGLVKEGAEIVALGRQAVDRAEYIYASDDDDHGHAHDYPNPHLWLDPIYALQYADFVRDRLAAHDPDNADAYQANYEAFAARIEALDAAIEAATATIPEENRALFTFRDAYVYFARRYGFVPLGVVLPHGMADPSAQEVAAMIEMLRENGTPAIFGSAVYPSSVLDQIGREAGADYSHALYDDSLPGEPGDPENTYIGMMAQNARSITAALGGDPSPLDGLDISNVPDSEE